MSTLTFSVIDTLCEANDQSFFPPQVSLATQSTTTIATYLGFSEWIHPSTPPKKYKKITWSGTSVETANVFVQDDSGQPYVFPGPDQSYTTHTIKGMPGASAGGAQYQWLGADEIDSRGNTISTHQKF